MYRSKQKQKRNLALCITLIILIFIIGVFSFILLNRNVVLEKYGSFLPLRNEYDTAYYYQKTYSNTEFQVIFDDEDNGEHLVRFTPSDSSLDGELRKLDGSEPPCEIIEVKLPDNEYKELINGFSMFEGSITVTDVIIRAKENNQMSYLYQYVEQNSESSHARKLCKKALVDFNESSDSESREVKGERLDMSRKSVDEYLSKYKFEKVEL